MKPVRLLCYVYSTAHNAQWHFVSLIHSVTICAQKNKRFVHRVKAPIMNCSTVVFVFAVHRLL